MLFLPVALAPSLGEEGVHSCAGTITVTLAPLEIDYASSHSPVIVNLVLEITFEGCIGKLQSQRQPIGL